MHFQLNSWITHARILPDNTLKSYKKVFPKSYKSNQVCLLRHACFKKQRIIIKKLVTNQTCCQLNKTWEMGSNLSCSYSLHYTNALVTSVIQNTQRLAVRLNSKKFRANLSPSYLKLICIIHSFWNRICAFLKSVFSVLILHFEDSLRVLTKLYDKYSLVYSEHHIPYFKVMHTFTVNLSL